MDLKTIYDEVIKVLDSSVLTYQGDREMMMPRYVQGDIGPDGVQRDIYVSEFMADVDKSGVMSPYAAIVDSTTGRVLYLLGPHTMYMIYYMPDGKILRGGQNQIIRFKTILTNLSKGRKLRIQISYLSKTAEEIPFHFYNATKALELMRLKIADSDGLVLIPENGAMISPRDRDGIDTIISDTKAFTYTVEGDLKKIDGNKIFLDLFTAHYHHWNEKQEEPEMEPGHGLVVQFDKETIVRIGTDNAGIYKKVANTDLEGFEGLKVTDSKALSSSKTGLSC
jgi:hypothetical protein